MVDWQETTVMLEGGSGKEWCYLAPWKNGRQQCWKAAAVMGRPNPGSDAEGGATWHRGRMGARDVGRQQL